MQRDTLARIHRVRTMQLTLARAEEARQRAALEDQQALTRRIAGLVDAVAPTQALHDSTHFAAIAHYRERLHQSAAAAAQRVTQAEARTAAATVASQDAKRDQTAVEKLIDRARIEADRRAMRALEDAPVFRAGLRAKRHDPC